jgi:hypothetical protein
MRVEALRYAAIAQFSSGDRNGAARWSRTHAANRSRQRQHADRPAIDTGHGNNILWEVGPLPEEPYAECQEQGQ